MGNEASVIPNETDQVDTANATRRANGSSRSAGSGGGGGAPEEAEDPPKCGASTLLSDPSDARMERNNNGNAPEGSRGNSSSRWHVKQPKDATGTSPVPDERGPRESPGLGDKLSGKVAGTVAAAGAAGGAPAAGDNASAATIMGGTVVESLPAAIEDDSQGRSAGKGRDTAAAGGRGGTSGSGGSSPTTGVEKGKENGGARKRALPQGEAGDDDGDLQLQPAPNDSSSRREDVRPNPGLSTAAADSSTASAAASSSKGRRHHHRHHRSRNRTKHGEVQAATYNNAEEEEEGEVGGGRGGSDAASSDPGQQEDKLKLLLEFIPYFGLGDVTRDNMVRSILSVADAEELAGDRDEYDNTLLILACQYRCRGLVPLILARGEGAIDVDAVNSAGACALHFACYKDSICSETVLLLLERGANPEVVENTYGCTPLHYAAGAGDLNVCKRLMEKGAKASTWDFYQYSAVDYAKQSGATDCVAYLEEVSALGTTANNAATVKFSAGGTGRGGIVTNTGLPGSDASAGFARGDSFDTVDEENSLNLARDSAAGAEGRSPEGGRMGLRRHSSSGSDSFSVGGEDGEGYWERQCDPASGMAYYLNDKSGESMWEKDLLSQAEALRDNLNEEEPSPELEQWLRQRTQRARLVALLGRHDPLKLIQVDEMLKRRLGDEDALIAELAKSYAAEEDPLLADLIKDAIRGFRDRKTGIGASASSTLPSASLTDPPAKLVSSDTCPRMLIKVDSRAQLLTAAAEGRSAAGVRPPTAPSHGPGRRTGSRPATASSGSVLQSTLPSTGSTNKLLPAAPAQVSPEDIKKLQEQNEKRLEDANTAHEETLEAERRSHRDREAEGEGTIARLEHDLEEASAEEERIRAKAEEQRRLIEPLDRQLQEQLASQSGAVKLLSEEAVALRAELATITEETQALSEVVNKEQSGAVAAAESSRRDAEAKAKEESDLVNSCQASVATAKSDAERGRREFEARRRAEQQSIQDRLGEGLARVQKELATAKAKAAMDVSRAQSDAAAAKSKAEATAATWAQVSVQREQLRVELEKAALTAERNALLQGLVLSESERRKKLHNKMEDLKGKIRVYVRVRPFSQKERDRGCTEAVVGQGKQTIAVQDAKSKGEKTFDFDQVWSGTEEQGNNQVNIFKDTGYLVTSTVDGYNVCIFAYGQTGSGKTYTMFGAGGIGGGVDAETGQCDGTAGVTPRAVLELFRVLKERESQYEYSVKVSMFELYRDGLRDLLAKKGSNTKLVIKLAEHSGTGLVVVEGGVEKDANDIQKMIDTIQLGAEGRTVSSTQMNSDSSRSHLLCTIVVTSTNRKTGSSLRGKLTLVDLAGSERVGKSGAAGDQLKEAQSINKSLSALGDVIGALTTGVKHIPYRNHALTMMMSDSLGGNSKTLMFVCASPADYNAAETINALQFAARCKSVTNSAGAGGGAAAAAQVQALRKELQKLKGEVGGGGGEGPANTPIQLARPL